MKRLKKDTRNRIADETYVPACVC